MNIDLPGDSAVSMREKLLFQEHATETGRHQVQRSSSAILDVNMVSTVGSQMKANECQRCYADEHRN